MILAWIMSLNLLWLRRVLLFIYDNWKGVLIVILGLIVFFWFVSLSYCNKPAPKLNEKEIHQAQEAIKEKNDEKLKEILVNSDARVSEIDSNIASAESNTRNAAKNDYSNMNTSELQQEIERRAKK